MSRIPVQILYTLAFGLLAFALVWIGHEGITKLGPGSYIRSGDQWVDLQIYHVVPLAADEFVARMLPVGAVFSLVALAWAGAVAWGLRKLRSGLQPICAYLFGAIGGIGVFVLATGQGLFVPAGDPYPFLSATVLGMGSAAYALAAVRMNDGWLARIGDVALVVVSIAFSMGWSYALRITIE